MLYTEPPRHAAQDALAVGAGGVRGADELQGRGVVRANH
jgi:hypothetical protein